MMMHNDFMCCVLLIITSSCCIWARPQQNTDLTAIIEGIFSTSPTRARTRGDVGFDTIVTPIPRDESQPPIDFNSISGQVDDCTCVRYHQCDPQTNEIRANDDSNDDAIHGFGLIDLRSSVCDHYLDVCCATNQTRSNSVTPRPSVTTPAATGCGIRNVGGIDFKLVNDTDNEAGFGEFPWTVALLHASNFTYFCSGSLIHPRVVLTALHCLQSHTPPTFVVRAGEWDSQTTRERLPFQERAVERILTHPLFNIRNVAYDFALVILNDAFTIDQHINIVCLPPKEEVTPHNTICYSNGWGKDVFGAAGRYSAIMKRIPLPVVDYNICQQRLRQTRLGALFRLDPTFMCAGGERGMDTCEGDGGAPLVCPIGDPSENRFHQSGIVAWGIGCNQEIPAAYVNVAKGRDWIDEQMLMYGFGTSSYQM